MQTVPAGVAERQHALFLAVHVLVADRALRVGVGEPFLRLAVRRGGCRGRGRERGGDGFAGDARVGVADVRVRKRVGRERRVREDLFEFVCEQRPTGTRTETETKMRAA